MGCNLFLKRIFQWKERHVSKLTLEMCVSSGERFLCCQELITFTTGPQQAIPWNQHAKVAVIATLPGILLSDLLIALSFFLPWHARMSAVKELYWHYLLLSFLAHDIAQKGAVSMLLIKVCLWVELCKAVCGFRAGNCLKREDNGVKIKDLIWGVLSEDKVSLSDLCCPFLISAWG